MARVLRDFRCIECSYIQDDFAEIDDIKLCPQCGSYMRHVWISAPNSNNLGQEGSDRSVAAMKRSFDQRFVKKEMDDVRHKHGESFDQSLASSALKRIKNGEA